MPRPKKAGAILAPTYQLKITLEESDPPIWRRVLVRGDASLHRLNRVIQLAMGWQNCHFHEFDVDGERYGKRDVENDDETLRSETRFTLQQVAPKVGAVLRYWYDFGDDWWHTIEVEKILDPDPAHAHPTCIGGKNACPPEDCGGIWGYYGMLEAVADPEHEQHEELLEWLGGSFDPRHFDIDLANRSLRRMKG